jgi:hypothetical protein
MINRKYMRQILCLLLVLLIGGKDGAHSLPLEVKPLADQVNGQVREVPDESLDPASFPEGFTPREIGAKLYTGRTFSARRKVDTLCGSLYLVGGFEVCADRRR